MYLACKTVSKIKDELPFHFNLETMLFIYLFSMFFVLRVIDMAHSLCKRKRTVKDRYGWVLFYQNACCLVHFLPLLLRIFVTMTTFISILSFIRRYTLNFNKKILYNFGFYELNVCNSQYLFTEQTSERQENFVYINIIFDVMCECQALLSTNI